MERNFIALNNLKWKDYANRFSFFAFFLFFSFFLFFHFSLEWGRGEIKGGED